jgi:hypothetical protein
MTFNEAVAKTLDITSRIIGFAFMALVAIAIARHFGVNVPMIKPFTPTDLAYTAGSWWLIRKAG